MPHTLLFVSAYTGLGGGESVQLNLMGALDPAEWALHLATPREGQLPEAARALGVRTHIVPYRGVPTWFLPPVWMRLPAARRQIGRASCRERGEAWVVAGWLR